MKRILANMPRNVLLSLIVIATSLVALGVLYATLAQALSAAIDHQASLNASITRTNSDITTAGVDHKYVLDNQAQYEALLKSDRLVPHTRRAAVAALQKVVRDRGISSLSYSFSAAAPTSATSASAQPTSGAYRLSVEDVAIDVGAPFDGPIYGFVADITAAFPGAAVVQSVDMRRVPALTDTMFDLVSRGEDAKIVQATVKISWRTAQLQETEKQK